MANQQILSYIEIGNELNDENDVFQKCSITDQAHSKTGITYSVDAPFSADTSPKISVSKRPHPHCLVLWALLQP